MRRTARTAIPLLSVGLVTNLAAGLLGGLTGCTDINARTTIGAEREIPALAATDTLAGAGAGETPLTRLDRGDWAPIEYRLPVDGTVHPPAWRSHARFSDEQRRQHGLYPTAESALDLDAPRGEQALRGVTEPARALADVFIMPVRMVLDPVWDLEQSPRLYKRWRSGEWLAGPMPDAVRDEPVDGGS